MRPRPRRLRCRREDEASADWHHPRSQGEIKYFQGYTEMEYHEGFIYTNYLILVSCMHTVKVLLKHTV